MKKLTSKEALAVRNAVKQYLTDQTTVDIITDSVIEAIDAAEGYPATSGDKYTDKKLDLTTAVKNLNDVVKSAHDIGLTIDIQSFVKSDGSQLQPRTIFQLAKVYKEF